jgi:two-component system alkaline phosphatase synthesis response regulator PhoP
MRTTVTDQVPPIRAAEGRRTVLVVDDSEDAHEIYRSCLDGEPYEMLSALDGRAALQLLEQGAKPDAIVVDLLMPIMDGMEVYVALRGKPEFMFTPVIVASAVAVPAALRLPDVHYLTKPFRREELLLSLHTLTKRALPRAGK